MGQQNDGFFLSQKKLGLKKFLRHWNGFAAKTKFRNGLEFFGETESWLIFLSEEKKEEKLDLD